MAAEPRPAAVDHRTAQVGQRGPLLAQPREPGVCGDEGVLDDLLRPAAVPQQQRAQPDEPDPVGRVQVGQRVVRGAPRGRLRRASRGTRYGGPGTRIRQAGIRHAQGSHDE